MTSKSELELLDPRLLEVIGSAAMLAQQRDARGVARAGDCENLADDYRTWRASGCPVLRRPRVDPSRFPTRCLGCQATRDQIAVIGHTQINVPPDPYKRCPQSCDCEPQHFSIAECEAGD